MIKSTDIDFQLINPIQFEELCFKLISKLGYEKIRWRQGAADNGRDIQAVKRVSNDLLEYSDVWFFECKHYKGGVPPTEFESKFTWANTKKPEHLVFLLSSHITNNGDTYMEERASGVDYQVHLIQGNDLKEVLIKHPDLIKEFGLIDSDFVFIQLLKDKWIIHNEIPTWHVVASTIQTTNYEHLSNNEAFLLISLLEIHRDLNYENGIEEETFYDIKNELIELGFSRYKKDDLKKSEFTLEHFENMTWKKKKSYGELYFDFENDDYFTHGSLDEIMFDGVQGWFGFITIIEADDKVFIPYFIAQDSSLSLTLFRKIISSKFKAIHKSYESKRGKLIK